MTQNLATDPQAQARYHEDGSWGAMSDGWPDVAYTPAKFLLCSKAEIVPYGQYVVVGGKHTSAGYDYSEARIRCATQELCDKLDRVHNEMFVICRDSIERELAW